MRPSPSSLRLTRAPREASTFHWAVFSGVCGVAAQASRAERLAAATHVIENGGPAAALGPQVDALWRSLADAAGAVAPSGNRSEGPSDAG